MADQQSRRLIQDQARRADVDLKHERVRGLLNQVGADAILFQNPANIAWITGGGDLFRGAFEEPASSVFMTSDARLFATNSVDSAQIFEREAFGLGFQLKQREWFQPHRELVDDLCRGRNVLSDTGVGDTRRMTRAVTDLRHPLTTLEVERCRMLARIAVHAVEATAHHVRAGMTESEVAGQLSHRLLRRTVQPARIQACADGRSERFRHWTFGEQPVQQYATISCVVRRWGLHIGVTRTVCLDQVPAALEQAYRTAAMVHATGLFFTRAGQTLGNVWKKVQRIYEKFGVRSEWLQSDQASVMGYSTADERIRPESREQVLAPSTVFWHPSVGPALLGDSLLCFDASNELVTLSETWPQIKIRVKGRQVTVPGILLVPTGDSPPQVSDSQAIDCLDHPREEMPGAVESKWEIQIPSDHPVWAEDSPWSPESVLE